MGCSLFVRVSLYLQLHSTTGEKEIPRFFHFANSINVRNALHSSVYFSFFLTKCVVFFYISAL